jgi:hypothetical protein
MSAPEVVLERVEHFRRNKDEFRTPSYKETRLRIEFVDPFFEALGWDVANRAGYAEAYKDVVHEDSVKVETTVRAPDYAFRIGGVRKFFVETKSPFVDIRNSGPSAYQLRRYGWSAKLPLSILTDFEEFAVYDCRIKPTVGDKASKARTLYIRYEDYESRWDEIKSIFSREAILLGSFDKYAQTANRRGTAEVDGAFLAEIERWRSSLAQDIASHNYSLSVYELNDSVQKIIDRIVFLRIAEDRGFERYGTLQDLSRGRNVYSRLVNLFRMADARYNSGLFHFDPADGVSDTSDTVTPTLIVGDRALQRIFASLYYPESPYEFSVLPADILGQVYERFLGNVIVLKGHSASVEEKPEVRKFGGVYYTPTTIVSHIVASTLGPLLTGKTPGQLEVPSEKQKRSKQRCKVLDPACGSGSFLIVAYQYLLDWYLQQYVSDTPEKYAKGRNPRVYLAAKDEWRLTIAEKRRILLNHIYGADVDAQAVEVTKLSLLMKVLEGERVDAVAAQMDLFHMRALPDLGKNIRCGNSLVGTDIYSEDIELGEEDEIKINPFDWGLFINEATGGRGFDAIIGNPPYVLLQDENRQELLRQYFSTRYRVSNFKMDLYHLFIERGVSLLSKNGALSYITPSNFLTNNYAVPIRKQLTDNGHLAEIINIKGRVFQAASVDTCIFRYEASRKLPTIDFVTARYSPSGLTVVNNHELPLDRILADPDRLLVPSTVNDQALLKSIDLGGKALGELAHVNFGKQLRDRSKHPSDVIQLSGKRAPDGYARCYTGRDISRYRVQWSGLACLTDRVAQSGGCWDDERQSARLKLLCRQVGSYPEFAIDELGYQCLNTLFMIGLFDQEAAYFTLGILNSEVIRYYWTKKFSDGRDTFPKIKGTYLKQLPVIQFSKGNPGHAAVASTVRKILEGLDKLARARTESERNLAGRKLAALDDALQSRIASLYGLDSEQITVIRDDVRGERNG